MAYTTKTQYSGYVKFLRGTPAAWDLLPQKDSDTLYFISESSADRGKLYLGSKLISDGNVTTITSITQLQDILVSEGVPNNALLVYDSSQKKWVSKPLAEVLSTLVSVMTGATEEADGYAGLVPVPKKGDQELFLRGDATWADPTAAVKEELSKLQSNLQGQITDLKAGDTGSIRSIAADEIAKLVGAAPEKLDTLEEIAEWITDHDDAINISQTVLDVQDLKDAVFGTEEQEGKDGLVSITSSLNEIINGNEEKSGLVSVVSTLQDNYIQLNQTVTTLSTNYVELNETVTDIDQRLKWQDLTVVEENEEII